MHRPLVRNKAVLHAFSVTVRSKEFFKLVRWRNRAR